jgi:uncharacterized metal-binding protein
MSCLAGIAAQKPSFLRKIKNKKIVTIDGCPTECSKGVFDTCGITVDMHIKLKEYGIKKNSTPRDHNTDSLVSQIAFKIKNCTTPSEVVLKDIDSTKIS